MNEGKIQLDQRVFEIDAQAYTERICEFISRSMINLHRDGVIVPLSGGLDSSTVLLLCLRAVGAEKLTALMMPEEQGNPEALFFSRMLTSRYSIKTITRNISPILLNLGTYDFVLSLIPTRRVKEWASRRYLRQHGSPFLDLMTGGGDGFQRKGQARITSKHRIRAVVEFMIAEERNLLVAGCAHKSEDLLGLFVKFGVDDIADIMPLKNLYRSHILQIAAYLGVPSEIIQRTPNPDIVPGVTDKYQDMLGLSSEIVDLLLYGIERGMDDQNIATQLNLSLEKVQEIRNLVKNTSHMRNPSQSVTWDG